MVLMFQLIDYIIPSDNWEQQLKVEQPTEALDYIIPSDNWEQQQGAAHIVR